MITLALLLALLASPVQALGWQSYQNARFGYVIAVPPGFTGGPEIENGAGRVFRSADGRRRLTVRAGALGSAGFVHELEVNMAADRQHGWKLRDQTTTPNWASYAASKGQRQLVVRIVAACKGTRYALFGFEYPGTEIAAMAPIVSRLIGAFRAGLTCAN